MRVNCRCSLPVLVLFGVLTAIHAASSSTANAQSASPTTFTYPQIVRLSYVEGDVRVARGKEAEKQLEKESGDAIDTSGWEQAAANLPLETGYSLVTGTGRAEIEFEDASVVYLADNSVLTFNELSTTNGVPTTEIALLSGTATMNVQNMVPGESFRIYHAQRQLHGGVPEEGVSAGEQLPGRHCSDPDATCAVVCAAGEPCRQDGCRTQWAHSCDAGDGFGCDG